MLTINPPARTMYPNVKMGILAMRNITSSSLLSQSVIEEAMHSILNRYGSYDRAGLKALYPIQAYARYYRQFGYSYHVLGQLESILKGKQPPHAPLGILQAMFLTELETMLLTAGHDLARIQSPLQVNIATGSETYVSISGRNVSTVANDLMVCDQSTILSSILRGPDHESRITAATTDVLFTIYAPPGIQTDTVLQALQLLEARLYSLGPSSDTLLLQVYA